MAAQRTCRYAAASRGRPETSCRRPPRRRRPAPATEDQWQVGRLVALGFIGLFLGLSPFYAGLFDLGLWAPCALVVIASVVALFVAGVRPTGWPAVAAVIALTAFAGWTWLSTLWANDPGAAEIDAARYTFYAAALTLVACLLRGRRSGMVLLGAATAGVLVVAADVLSRMLFGDGPGLFIAGRLNDPLGYVNGEAVAFLMAIWPLDRRRRAGAEAVAGRARGGPGGDPHLPRGAVAVARCRARRGARRGGARRAGARSPAPRVAAARARRRGGRPRPARARPVRHRVQQRGGGRGHRPLGRRGHPAGRPRRDDRVGRRDRHRGLGARGRAPTGPTRCGGWARSS